MTGQSRIQKARPLQRGRLTPFQALMRHWSALTPFNFAHAMRLAEPLDLKRWQQAAGAVIGGMNPAGPPISVATDAVDLDALLTAELNRGFDDADLPVRFFAIDAHDGGHWFGATIDHWWADDFSCRALLEKIFSAYRTGTNPDGEVLGRPTAPPRPRSWLGELIAFMKEAARYRRACRLPLRDPLDFRTQTFRTAFPEGALREIRQFAKLNDATVHDALLAVAAQAFGARHGSPRKSRDAVALISAMDLRPFENSATRTAFGVALSQYAVVVPQPDNVSARAVLRQVSAQTRPLKDRRGTDVFRAALLVWRLSRSEHAKATWFHRAAPASAGLSNVNLTGSWMERPEISDYRRVATPGTAVPMVLMITTFKGRLFIDTTFRMTAFSRTEAEGLVADLQQRLLDAVAGP